MLEAFAYPRDRLSCSRLSIIISFLAKNSTQSFGKKNQIIIIIIHDYYEMFD